MTGIKTDPETVVIRDGFGKHPLSSPVSVKSPETVIHPRYPTVSGNSGGSRVHPETVAIRVGDVLTIDVVTLCEPSRELS